ncbi:neuraminidase [Verticillium alfalfae VaMs.102]|uniref:Neuraminidase n=1 Tax=Verticillium alfalfae (strain VaMs.102 / ATCC MYA-4576 / FGSC 10136) TaxID=526221 RepID=C9SZ95_VERA1|nr:neuraminidase [Verticillium alfalfae VaMs.102]EEY24110.1 neuraminidase [Verticillium alfalfae VaMs.102]
MMRLLTCSALVALPLTLAISIRSTDVWDIATDIQGPERLNGVSYQEDVLVTFGDYQYVTFYSTTPAGYNNHHVNLGRRRIEPSVEPWEYLAFTDYVQRTMDGHNMISMGISGDGHVHLSFDHHDVPLNYRVSKTPIALEVPATWSESLFNEVVHELPGSQGPWTPLTYPRFELLGNGDLLMEFRIGPQWKPYGKYLEGYDNNAYINGLSYLDGRLYTSWTVRETPNADTNHDFYFAYSDDDGQTWFNSNGSTLPQPISTALDEPLVWEIPQNSRMVNQEGQLVDSAGRFHSLMRDNITGHHLYQHFMRDTDGTWSKSAINPSGLLGPDLYDPRGKLAADASGEYVIALLPVAATSETRIYVASAREKFRHWVLLTSIPNTSTEPLYDQVRLREYDVLSVFVRQAGSYPDRMLQVWDFKLEL